MENWFGPACPTFAPTYQGGLQMGHFAMLSPMKNVRKVDFELDLRTFPVELETWASNS